MIYIREPNFVFNACDVGINYKMRWVYNAPEFAMPADLGAELARACRYYLGQGTPLSDVVFNCHGNMNGVWVGGMEHGKTFMNKDDLVHLHQVAPFGIKRIWMTSCRSAEDANGQAFCWRMAKITKAKVIASNKSQEVGATEAIKLKTMTYMPGYRIDDFEGDVYEFHPDGATVRRVAF